MEPNRANWRFSARQTAVRLFVTCWIIYVLHFATNIVRELYPAMALGDHLSFDVSEYAGLHPDIFEMEGRGAFINNNPGASIVGAVPYALARPVIDRVTQAVRERRESHGGGDTAEYDSPWPMAREFYRRTHARGLDVKFGLAAGVTQALAMAPLSALSAVVMFKVLTAVTSSVRAGFWLSVLYAFATPIFYRTAQLNQNLLATHCALFAFVLLWRPSDSVDQPRRPYYFWAGLLAGWAVVCDYSGLIVVLVLGGYALIRRGLLPRELKCASDPWRYVGGAFLAGCVLMAYQWCSFGHPIFPAQHYMPAANFTDMGYAGFSWPQFDLLWATAFNMRYGLFLFAPILLLVLWIPGWVGKDLGPFRTPERICIVVFVVAFFLFCSANQYGRMQFNTGVRHVIPVTPFLFLPVAIVLTKMPIILASLVGIVTTYWSWCLSMYREVELGRGILESPIHITTEGPMLPWLTTLERMGVGIANYLPGGVSAGVVVLCSGAVIAILWRPMGGARGLVAPSDEGSKSLC